MANKKITELQLKSSVVGDESCPVDNGIQSYRTTPSQWYDYFRTRLQFSHASIENLSIVTSVGSSALTIALKTKAAADASSTDPILVGFRSATLTSGAYVYRSITGALSLVVSSGSTLGQVSGQASRLYVYLIDNAGSPELAVSSSWYPEHELVSTTAEGGAGGADSRTVIYSTSARSNVALRLIGMIDNTQATAGTWASAGTKIQLMPADVSKQVNVVTYTSGSGTYYPSVGCRAIRVRMVGGGGSGAGGGTSTATAGSAGNSTTFGSWTAGGGGAGQWGSSCLAGTANTFSGTGYAIPSTVGGSPCSGAPGGGLNISGGGGHGGSSYFGGAGCGGYATTGGDAKTNSGSGGGGGGNGSSGGTAVNGGSGGGSGGFIEGFILNPDASYSYGVGAAQTSVGSAGTAGGAGGQGAAGFIIIEEYF